MRALAVVTIVALGACGPAKQPSGPTSTPAPAPRYVARGDWQLSPSEPYRGKQDDFSFVSPTVGFYGNGLGRIFRTDDGGQSWQKVLDQPGTYFRAIGFLDEQRGFAGNLGPDAFPGVTDPNLLYRTDDGGKSWKAVALPDVEGARGVCAIDILKVDAVNAGHRLHKEIVHVGGRVGGPAALFRSDDGGTSWSRLKLPSEIAMILDVKFLDPSNGFVFAGSDPDVTASHGLIARTEDAGRTWKVVYESRRPFELMWKGSFPSRRVGYASLQNYSAEAAADPEAHVTADPQRYVVKTTDGGATWAELPVVADGEFQELGIGFVDDQQGWIGGMPRSYHTTDGGATWKPVESMPNAANKLRFVKDGERVHVWAIGMDIRHLLLEPAGVRLPPPSPPAAYDPPVPTLRMPDHFRPTAYRARLAVDPALPTFTGDIQIDGTLTRESSVIYLHGQDLHIHSATATAEHAPNAAATATITLAVTQQTEDILELRPRAPLAAGHYTLQLAYDGTIEDVTSSSGAYLVKYGAERYVVTQFEASSARLVFPCIDEPGTKVPWQLTLDVPKGLVAVANTPVLTSTPLDDQHERVTFAATRPLPSYLVAFGVGPFDVVDAGKSATGTPLRVLAPHGEAARATYAASVMPAIVNYLAEWTGVAFPYPKLDLLLRDGGGAMENAGLITMELDVGLIAAQPTPLERYDLVSELGHEAAHQWFGDYVTAAWWDDIWLNESFATFMEDKIETAVDPTTHDEGYPVSRRNAAWRADSIASARQIRQPIVVEGDIHNAFDGITYPKGSSILSMFEAYLGPVKFQAALRAYLAAHADGSATVADVVSALQAQAPPASPPLAPAFASFLDQPGIPELAVKAVCVSGQPAKLELAQHRFVGIGSPPPATAQLWQFPICVAYERADHARGERCGWVRDATTVLELPQTSCPTWVVPDAGARVYARPAYTTDQAIALRDLAWPLLTPQERRGGFAAVVAQARNGRLPVAIVMSFVPKLLAGDRFAVGDATGDPVSDQGATGLPIEPMAIAPHDWPAVQARMRALYGPLVKKLGVHDLLQDDLSTIMERMDLVAAALAAAEPSINAPALKLAQDWGALSGTARTRVMPVAVNANPEYAARIRREALAERRPDTRQALLRTLAATRDPARLTAVMDLMVDPSIGPFDLLALLDHAPEPVAQETAATWLRAHARELVARFPGNGHEDFPAALFPLRAFAPCDAVTRDADAAFIGSTWGGLASGARPAQQAIERMDQCIARRAIVGPSVTAWLTTPKRRERPGQ